MSDDKYRFNGEVDLDKTDKLASKYLFNSENDNYNFSNHSYDDPDYGRD